MSDNSVYDSDSCLGKSSYLDILYKLTILMGIRLKQVIFAIETIGTCNKILLGFNISLGLMLHLNFGVYCDYL